MRLAQVVKCLMLFHDLAGRAALALVNWHVLPEFFGYDHKYIRFDIINKTAKELVYMNPRKTKYENFNEELRPVRKECPPPATNSVEI